MNPTDRMRTRKIQNILKLVDQHLEAMQRDVHGLEYAHWKDEVDYLWKSIFEHINRLSDLPQQSALQMIREDWTTYITHYSGIGR